jgi:hypothetical protein
MALILAGAEPPGVTITGMAATPIFPSAKAGAGMYESFYMRAVSPEEPVGAWIRYTVHKRPGQAPTGSLWCTVFDASAGWPFMHKCTTGQLTAPAGGWIEIGGDSRLGPGIAEGACGPASWSLRFHSQEPELRHLKQGWLYKAPLPRTKLTSPAPAASFDGTIVLEGSPARTLRLDGWRGMVGHNWGSEHAERWIWLHGVGFDEDATAWIDVALGRVIVAGRLTPWIANGAISLDGRRLRVGGLAARGVHVAESVERCELRLPGEGGLTLHARVAVPAGTAAGWRYDDPDGGAGHDVVNCSIARLELSVTLGDRRAPRTLTSAYGGAYELGMRERDHGGPIAPLEEAG